MSASLVVGTSGFAYADWKPRFYPDGLAQAKFLSHYATRLNGVEINYTFNRFPTERLLEGWAAKTPDAFTFLTVRHGTVAGLAARIFRISFSGELSYEVYVKAWYGRALWDAIEAAGADLDVTPYGTETMHVLRAEKGYPIVGQDTDGTVTPQDAGMEWIVSKAKEFIGKRSYARADGQREDRKHLVSVLPVDGSIRLPEGTQLVEQGISTSSAYGPVPMQGFVTSSYHSAALGRSFGLALIKNGRNRIGENLVAVAGDQLVDVVVAETVLFDPEGTRKDG